MAKKKQQSPVNLPAQIGQARTERKAVEHLKPAAHNPRKLLQPGDAEYKKLHRSIEQFGYVDPLIWNERTGNLVGGHQRLNVLLNEYGVTELDVVVVDVDEAHEKALNVALNKIEGSWDDAKLSELLAELENDQDIDVQLTGFDLDEIEREFNVAVDGLADSDIGSPANSPNRNASKDDDGNANQSEGEKVSEDGASKLGKYEFRIIIDCDDEEHQRASLEALEKQGYTCRALIS